MCLYIELAKKSFQRQITYRGATLAGWVTNLFFGMLRASVFIAVYGSRVDVAGYSLQDAITYTAFTQALIAAIALWGWFDMIRSIKSGEVASDLSKPFDYYGFWLAQDMGRGLYQFIARGVTIMIAYLFFFRLSAPDTLLQWALVAITLLLAILLSFTWRFLISVLAFWTTDAMGLARMAFFLALFPSGFTAPLAFMPDWLQTLCRATPFPGFVDTPVTIYLGRAQGVDALHLILQQMLWIVVLMVLGRMLAEAGRRKLTIQGG